LVTVGVGSTLRSARSKPVALQPRHQPPQWPPHQRLPALHQKDAPVAVVVVAPAGTAASPT